MNKRIDIYVDGSWLNQGRHNPVETGGWSFVVVESGSDKPKYEFGRGEPTWKSNDAETMAIRKALEHISAAGYPRETEIVLHTDQGQFVGFNKDRLAQLPPERHTPTAIAYAELKQLAQENNVTIKYIKHQKSAAKNHPESDPVKHVHALARREAWLARLEAQGGEIFLGKEFSGEAARKAIEWQYEREKESHEGRER